MTNEALGVSVLDTADTLRQNLDGRPDDQLVAVPVGVLRAVADLLDGYGRQLLGIADNATRVTP